MKTAVVLFNLGGPDSLDAVEPFLRNLFSDPAIIGLPNPLRWLIAKLISSRRAKTAQGIYAQIGGKSPLRELTEAQAVALQARLNEDSPQARLNEDSLQVRLNEDSPQARLNENAAGGYRCFVAMRYWHPFADETAQAVAAYAPDKIVLLPLYPHYSKTTTGSSFKDWTRAAAATGLTKPTLTVRDYPEHPGYIAALAGQLRQSLIEVRQKGPFRLLFSAHGLPKKVIDGGDPYQAQIERTAAAVIAALGDDANGLDWQICYQSRVGPLEWIGPSTDDEIKRAGAEALSLVVLPIAFVSEHSETLVDLDIEYRELAAHHGVPFYIRVPALGTDRGFIGALADLVRQAG